MAMAKQSATDILKERICVLEIRQKEEGKALREELMVTYESLKPVNLLKSTIKEYATSEELKKTIFETAIALVNGFLAKQLIKPNPDNYVLKLITTLLQLGTANLLTNNRDAIYQFILGWVEKLIQPSKEKEVESGSFCE
jgi:hypothetical protein